MMATTDIPRPALRYRGGKWRHAKHIIAAMPEHECYVEPMIGGGSVLLQKPRSDFEVVNDLDGDIVAFFEMLRDQPEKLLWSIYMTPFAEDEYRNALKPSRNKLERARRLYARCWMGRGSSTEHGGWRFQKSWNGWKMNTPRYFYDLQHLQAIADRLRGVQICSTTYEHVVKRFDAPTTLLYLDPPYPLVTREASRKLYRHEWTDADHEHMAEIVRGLRSMVILSSYRSELYERLFPGWKVIEWTAYAEQQKATTECLWLNPAAQERLERDSRQQELPTEAS